jgi:hypothetical protein
MSGMEGHVGEVVMKIQMNDYERFLSVIDEPLKREGNGVRLGQNICPIGFQRLSVPK